MKLPRRKFLDLAVGAVALPAVSRIARRRLIRRGQCASSSAGASDISARLIGPWLSERLGQPFLIENRAGASSNIGTEAVVRAPSDGHTLLLATCINTINASLYEKLNFDFIRDMAPVARIAYTPLVVVVHPTVPAKNIPELIAYAKANPRKLNLASAGLGTRHTNRHDRFLAGTRPLRPKPRFRSQHEGGSELPRHEARDECQHFLALIGLVRIEACQDHETTLRRDDAPRRHEFMTIADNAKSARQFLQHQLTE